MESELRTLEPFATKAQARGRPSRLKDHSAIGSADGFRPPLIREPPRPLGQEKRQAKGLPKPARGTPIRRPYN
jgi:hypothetical protein